jgi:DNA-binding NtrC family response regulator
MPRNRWSRWAKCALRSLPKPLETPVVVLSGAGNIKAAVEALKLGAADFLEKPPSSTRLAQAISDALRDHNQGVRSDPEQHPHPMAGPVHGYRSAIETFEREALLSALQQWKRSIAAVARYLGNDRANLRRRMIALGIDIHARESVEAASSEVEMTPEFGEDDE